MLSQTFILSLFLLLPLTLAFPKPSNASLQSLKNDIKAGKAASKGVNLGGWLVAEHWMTGGSPIWNGVPDDIVNSGEYVVMKHLGHDQGDSRFDEHRRTFITEQDFEDISAAGLNTVRIPVGYWIVGFDNTGGGDAAGWKVYAPGALQYLDKAIKEWGPRHNVLVVISLHAAKGSQNGNEHSAPENPGHGYWSQYRENVQNTIDAVEWLVTRYKDDVAFLGIGLINEPVGQDRNTLKKYEHDAYARIRAHSDCIIYTMPLLDEQCICNDWQDFMPPSNFQNVRHEWHRYQIWGYEGWDADRILDYARTTLKNDIKGWTGNWMFIGEWSLANNANMNRDQLGQYSQAQQEAFSFANNAVGGWTYWTWKFWNDDGSSGNEWSMKDMVREGLFN